MESIFHEKQEGSLCAQHCLNALLQNQYFSAVDLAQIGERLDERERDRMAEGGVGTHDYQRFIQEPSSNFDDSGFFSVQVITEALSVWGLDVVLFNSQDPVAVQARRDPTQMSAFICNYLQHWFCVRKLGNQWFNLNSLLSGPELISDTYLSLFLKQLVEEGYSIFIVVGNLPDCEADQLLRLVPAVQPVKPRLLNEKETETVDGGGEEDRALKEALRISKELNDNDDTALQKALQLSMEGYAQSCSSSQLKPSLETKITETQSSSKEHQMLSPDELRLKRLSFLSKSTSPKEVSVGDESNSKSSTENTASDTGQNDYSDLTEEELLKQAIAMSMEHS
ncbi:ataxin-3-like [Biomphalaria glabrata]|uniref:ubiquitinyl hydrolase 1 n=1 Tax=Biomphalaria glabrata TaxID=6526 RepID=A0A2C9JZ15_BIOGL|nr:ataxin-3-like [Biomphalaria glabrata]